MPVDRSTSLFFDASCLYVAAQSPSGGSARLLRLCRLGWFAGWASQTVIVEAERGLRRKGSAVALHQLEQILRHTPLGYAPLPVKPEALYAGVNAKDAHVYAAARACAAHYLITLDKRLAEKINAQVGNPIALSPGEFLQQVLPEHPDYAAEPGAGQAHGGNEA